MSFVIHSIATAVPGEPYAQEETAECAAIVSCGGNEKDAASLRKLFKNTRIDSRYSVHGRPQFEAMRRGELVGPVPGPSTAVRMAEYVREALPLAARPRRGLLWQASIRPRSRIWSRSLVPASRRRASTSV